MQLDEYVDKTFLSVFDSDNEYSACLEDDPVLPFGAKDDSIKWRNHDVMESSVWYSSKRTHILTLPLDVAVADEAFKMYSCVFE